MIHTQIYSDDVIDNKEVNQSYLKSTKIVLNYAFECPKSKPEFPGLFNL